MKVLLAQSAGFCRGVKRAVDKATQLSRETGVPVYTDGPLIHNQQMMQELRSQQILESNAPETLRDVTLMIRAHGIPPQRREWLQSLPVRLNDATCPDVGRIQGLIRRHARQGFHTVIFGDPGHAEVDGLLGYAEGRGHVVASPADVATLPAMGRICVVSQSTQFPEEYEAVSVEVRKRYPEAVILDTICESTKSRQGELVQMAREVDAIVVVGGAHSANTVRLVELARSLRPTFHIQTADQLRPEGMKSFKTVGLTAGASTPSFIIDEVQATLERM